MSNKFVRELKSAGIPAMAVGGRDARISLGPPYRTKTGQWIIRTDGTAKWVGTGTPTLVPDAALLAKIKAVRAVHVQDLPKPPKPDKDIIIRALVKLARGAVESSLTQEEKDEIAKVSML